MPALAQSFRKAPKGPPGLTSLSDESQSTLNMPSLHMHCGGIWNFNPGIFGTETRDGGLAPPSHGEIFSIKNLTLPGIEPEAAACKAMTLQLCHSDGL